MCECTFSHLHTQTRHPCRVQKETQAGSKVFVATDCVSHSKQLKMHSSVFCWATLCDKWWFSKCFHDIKTAEFIGVHCNPENVLLQTEKKKTLLPPTICAGSVHVCDDECFGQEIYSLLCFCDIGMSVLLCKNRCVHGCSLGTINEILIQKWICGTGGLNTANCFGTMCNTAVRTHIRKQTTCPKWRANEK